MPDDYSTIVAAEFRVVGLPLSEFQLKKLTRYCEELERWNQKVNLTSLRGATLVRRLIVEPVWIATELEISGTVVDIGSGNGSPAIPIQCVRDVEAMHLVEARARRAAFLRQASVVLSLKNTQVHRALFQDAIAEIPAVDWVTLQAVTPTAELLDLVRKISKPTTVVVWITSDDSGAEKFPQAERRTLPFCKTSAVLIRFLRAEEESPGPILTDFVATIVPRGT